MFKKILLIFFIKLYFTEFVDGNFFKQFEEYINREENRRAKEVLESDLLGGSDNPKEIEIHCPQVKFQFINS